MLGSAVIRKRFATVLTIALVGMVAGLGYARVITLIEQEAFTGQAKLLGLFSGALLGLLLGLLDFVFLPSRYGEWLRTRPFVISVVLRTVAVTVLILFGLVIANLLIAPGRFVQEGLPVVVRDVIAAAILFFPVFFAFQVRRIVGGRVLVNFILGRYHRPVEEARIFMFLDIADSTALAQRLGDVGVHALINRFFFEMSEPVLRTGGEIHRYIGDEAVITWPLGTREENARALDCYFLIRDKLAANASNYDREFGAVPDFRVGVHGGPVVAGECGDEKQEIVYFGDTINTASRIQGKCREMGSPILISGELLDRIDLPETYAATGLGKVDLRGRREAIELFRIDRDSARPA